MYSKISSLAFLHFSRSNLGTVMIFYFTERLSKELSEELLTKDSHKSLTFSKLFPNIYYLKLNFF